MLRSGIAASSAAVYGCSGAANSASARALLDDLSRVHDGHAARHLGDDAHVVRDEDQRHAALALQRAQQIEDLRLDRHVERGRRLVGDQQPRVAGDGHRDHHALVHAARELMRKVAEPARRRGDADLLEQLDRATSRRLAIELQVQPQRLAELEADGEARIEARRRILEDHRDVLADERAALAVGQSLQIAPGEYEPLGADAAGIRDEPHHREHRDALAGARFADDAEHLAFVDREAHALDRVHDGALRRKLDVEVFDFEQGHGGDQRLSFGSSASRSPSPSRLNASTVIRIMIPGNVTTHHARSTNSRASASIVPHSEAGGCAPRPEEAQRRGVEDRDGHAERRLHDQRRRAVGQHLVEHEPEAARRRWRAPR